MSLNSFFNPTSIAIIGVSHEKNKVGYLVAKNMQAQGYTEKLYFVNPKGGVILGKDVYTDIKKIKEQIDLAVLAVPAKVALQLFKDLHEKNIHNVVLFAAGFKENGESGMDNEHALVKQAQEYGITLLGPNCIGFVNTEKNINTTFLKSVVPKGNIGFISQSGALGSVIVDEVVARYNLGLSYFVSMGNKSVMDESDVLAFLAEDDSTQVIAMYLEDVKDGEKFKRTLKNATLKKPVVILKSGSTEAGSKAALSHTGGMAGDDSIFSSLFKQCGAIRARDYIEFSTLLHLFSFDRAPVNKHILVLSNAGGVGVLLADELVSEGLSLVTVSEKTKQQLTKVFGDAKKITIHNPIDLLGDASAFDYQKAIVSTLQETDIGAVIILLTPQANTEILETAKVIVKAQQGFERPIYPVFMGKRSVQVAHDYFEQKKVASFRYHDYLVHAIAKAVWYRNYLSEHAGHVEQKWDVTLDEKKQSSIAEILKKNNERTFLDLKNSLDVMKITGIPVGELNRVRNEDKLAEVVEELGYPVTMKTASDKITHKTEVKGVIPGIGNLKQLKKAFLEMTSTTHTKSEGVFLQKQVYGYELFIGGKRDLNFGVVLVVGLGGIYAELFKDVTSRVFPISQREFIAMMKETKMHKLLSGFRGADPVDLGLVYDAVYRVGYLMTTFPEIHEIDINPVFVSSEGITAVDARIIL